MQIWFHQKVILGEELEESSTKDKGEMEQVD